MEEALKARNLGSAAARRQRIEERQLQQQLAHQHRLARKKEVMADIRALEAYNDDDEIETSSNSDLDLSTKSPSETSVQTPEAYSSTEAFMTLSPTIYDQGSKTMAVKQEVKEVDTLMAKSESIPRMQATLTTMADWNYDRFSMFVDPADVEEMLAGVQEVDSERDEEDSSSSLSSPEESSEDEYEEHSPIETAVPVSYTLLTVKPAVISIAMIRSRSRSLKLNTPSPQRLSSRKERADQIASSPPSSPPPSDDYRASEQTLYQIPSSSQETVESTNPSSQVSRSVSLASQSDSMMSRSFSQTSNSDSSHRSPKRKSSLPLLFGNNKNGHSRMSSFKKFIRSSTLGPPSSNPALGSMVQRHPSSATLETHFESESRDSSMESPRDFTLHQPKRSMTAYYTASPALSASDSLLSVPPAPTAPPPAIPLPTQKDAETRSIKGTTEPTQPRPTQKLRSRSDSIGQALKSISSGPKRTDASAPPVPTIFIPPPSASLSALSHPTLPLPLPLPPPPLTPRSSRRSMANYSPFPSPDKRASSMNVGLGLRY